MEFFKYAFFGGRILSIPIQVLSIFVRRLSLDDDISNLISKTAFVSSGEGNDAIAKETKIGKPDIEIMLLAVGAMEEHNRDFVKFGILFPLTCLFRAQYRGTVRLASANPLERPNVDLRLHG